MELLVKPEMLTSYIYGPTFGNAETLLKVCSEFQVFISYSFRVINFLMKSWKKGLWTLQMAGILATVGI